MRGARLTLIASLSIALVVGPSACVLGDLDLGAKRCPCGGGLVCDETRNVCVDERDLRDRDAALDRDGGAPEGGAFEDAGVSDAGAGDALEPLAEHTIELGLEHSCAIHRGALYCWGSNVMRQLGIASCAGDAGSADASCPSQVRAPVITSTAALVSLAIGEQHGCALTSERAIVCWGPNANGQLGTGDLDRRDRMTKIVEDLPSQWLAVSAGGEHTCAIRSDRTLWCWGSNGEGQIGLGPSELFRPIRVPRRVGTERDWIQITAGQAHTCGVRAGGSLWCWGRSIHGQLGVGSATESYHSPIAVTGGRPWRTIRAGMHHTCGIRDDGSIWCFGLNHQGQLGLGFAGSGADAGAGGADGGDAGCECRRTPERAASTKSFLDLDVSWFHGCAIEAGHELWCWGRNEEGALGLGASRAVEPMPARVGEASDWAEVALGHFHTCARRRDGTVWCTGANELGQLGLGPSPPRVNVLMPALLP